MQQYVQHVAEGHRHAKSSRNVSSRGSSVAVKLGWSVGAVLVGTHLRDRPQCGRDLEDITGQEFLNLERLGLQKRAR